jgi:hypothetical protein
MDTEFIRAKYSKCNTTRNFYKNNCFSCLLENIVDRVGFEVLTAVALNEFCPLGYNAV